MPAIDGGGHFLFIETGTFSRLLKSIYGGGRLKATASKKYSIFGGGHLKETASKNLFPEVGTL